MRKLAVLFFVLTITACGLPKEGTIVARNWVRVVHIEEWKTVREEDWDIPTGGRKVDSERRRRGSHACGTETRTYTDTSGKIKTESKTKYCPSYDDWYTYDIERWIETRAPNVGGGIEDDPVWPVYELRTNERVGFQEQHFWIVLKNGDVTWKLDTTYELWRKLPAGTKVGVEYDWRGNAVAINIAK